MIPRADIVAWRASSPWRTNEQVEQDLIICRALVEIFSDPFLRDQLAFRGGTALHKLYLTPPVRYSEDIDLVQLKAGPIGGILDGIRKALSFLGYPRVRQKGMNNTMVFSCDSEIPPNVALKLKVEINCREHFSSFKLATLPLTIESRWYSGECELLTYTLEELLDGLKEILPSDSIYVRF